ncbi:MAG TPA: TldD/PmbA family protein [Candidatus Wunengus californicus]|uniref:TldD/PmbA family protein n=1 Tax=Candidatus Wunengus californicus TaxID=3367619 RepID=UPI004029889B
MRYTALCIILLLRRIPIASRIKVELIDTLKETVTKVVQHAGSLKNCKYADIRLGIHETKYANAEDGKAKGMGEDASISFGIRVLAGEMSAWGYYGQSIGEGESNPKSIHKVLTLGIKKAYARAVANANKKAEFKSLAPSLTAVSLARIDICNDIINAVYDEDPRNVSLKDILTLCTKISGDMRSICKDVQYAHSDVQTGINRELFCSTEGACIDQSYTLTQGMVSVVAQKPGGIPEVCYDYVGDLRGWEVLKGKNVYKQSFGDFALLRTRETLELTEAEFLPATTEPVVVVTNPHFNALLAHEIVGHPTEADRVLKLETAYAGRSWLFRDFQDNELGKQIASPLLTAYSDPSIHGYGHFKYDMEGTPGKRLNLIENGILRGFMNGREYAAILGHPPNGSMRATKPHYVPIVRMTNTIFANGNKNPEEIIAEVKEGYYVVNHRIPSISESRENFRISAQKVFRIENGKITKLYRQGGITADSKDFLMNIDAIGNDFEVFPIPNCGKGQPMQVMRVGNGGPTLRSMARLTGH